MPPRAPARAAALLFALAFTLDAQEPSPASIRSSDLSGPHGVDLTLAWRFAPGDGPGRDSPSLDDAQWRVVTPALTANDLTALGWEGTGWFRRHLKVDPAVQGRTLAIRLAVLGSADVYLDGRFILGTGRDDTPPEIPGERHESTLISFKGSEHVLAVRYVYPASAARRGETIGFRITLAEPALGRGGDGAERPLMIAFQGAFVALPFFLAILHIVFFIFDTRNRGNLFYALEMAVITVLLLGEFRESFFTFSQQDRFELLVRGAPVAACFFGILTYYAKRTHPYPRSRPAFVAAGLVLFVMAYLFRTADEYGWQGYFLAVLVEVLRLEWRGRAVRRQRSRIFIPSFLLFLISILLQILVNNDLIPPIAGFRGYYMFGILALAVGVSLSLATELGRSRFVEAENERKTRELAQARELQLSMLPRTLPAVPGLEIAAASHTAAEVGGDYYDVRTDGLGGLLIAFGDATGHGLAAGIVVTAAKALFTSIPAEGALPDLLAGCDRVIREMRLPGLQMCFALARISPREAKVTSAAMPPVLVHRARTNAIEELGVGDLPLGSRIPLHFEERRTDLAPGDTLLFASDGFAELLDPEGHEMGYAGAAGAFREAAQGASARDVVERLGAAAAAFRGARPQDDDVTFVVVRVAAE
jgi:uncharacterized membrane protein (UPF0136 family)